MILTQTWVGYLDRSYQQIKQSVLSRIPVLAPELTDHSDSNPLITLVDIFSGIAETLNLAVDRKAQELYIGTAGRYSSLIKIADLLDYNIKTRTPATVNVTFTLRDTVTQEPVQNSTGSPLVVPDQTPLTSGQVQFLLQGNISIPPGQTSASGVALQITPIAPTGIGSSSGTPWMMFELPVDYATGSATIDIAGITYTEFESFSYMGPTTTGFVVRVIEDGTAWLVFGDGFTGAIPPSGGLVTFGYNATEGRDGNAQAGTLEYTYTVPGLPTGTELVLTNPDRASGGSEIEGMTDIRMRAPGVFSTKRRAVTKRDYEDIALQVPGVGHSKVDFCCCEDCANNIDLYIAPKTQGIATDLLITDVEDYMDDKIILGRKLNVLPAGITRVFIRAVITAIPGVSANQVLSDVYFMLYNTYSYPVSEINRKMHYSDFISTIRQVKTVESVSIDKIYLEPYARPLTTPTDPLNLSITGDISSTIKYTYRVAAVDVGAGLIKYNISRNGVFQTQIDANTPYTNLNPDSLPILTFTIDNTALTHNDGDNWEFTVYPTYPEILSDYHLDVDDNTIPIIDIDYDTLLPNGLPTVFGDYTAMISTTSSNNCQEPC